MTTSSVNAASNPYAPAIEPYRSFAKNDLHQGKVIVHVDGNKFKATSQEKYNLEKYTTSYIGEDGIEYADTIVNHFQRALENKYGKDFATQIFHPQEIEKANDKGLSHEVIKQIFDRIDSNADRSEVAQLLHKAKNCSQEATASYERLQAVPQLENEHSLVNRIKGQEICENIKKNILQSHSAVVDLEKIAGVHPEYKDEFKKAQEFCNQGVIATLDFFVNTIEANCSYARRACQEAFEKHVGGVTNSKEIKEHVLDAQFNLNLAIEGERELKELTGSILNPIINDRMESVLINIRSAKEQTKEAVELVEQGRRLRGGPPLNDKDLISTTIVQDSVKEIRDLEIKLKKLQSQHRVAHTQCNHLMDAQMRAVLGKRPESKEKYAQELRRAKEEMDDLGKNIEEVEERLKQLKAKH